MTAGSPTCPMPSSLYNPGLNLDFYSLGHDAAGHLHDASEPPISSSRCSRTRAPGMSINRMPILIWGTLTACFANLLVIPARQPRLLHAVARPALRHTFLPCRRRRPAAAVAASLLDLRPSLGLRHRAAGDGLRFGRPADVLPPSTRRLYAGCARYRRHQLLGFGVWVHHMFATGLPGLRCPSSARPAS